MHGQNVLTRGGLLKRGAIGGGALLASATGLAAVAPAALADAPPAGDLAYLRLLIAAELLASDFYGQTVGSSTVPSREVMRRIAIDEQQHYTLLAGLLVADGQTPATPGDFDFSYTAGTFATPRAVLRFGKELERMLIGAYIDALEHVQTPAYRLPMARILANHAQHHGALAALQGSPVIQKALPTRVSMEAMSTYLGRFES